MTRWLGILLMGITVPIFLTALTGQEPGKEEDRRSAGQGAIAPDKRHC